MKKNILTLFVLLAFGLGASAQFTVQPYKKGKNIQGSSAEFELIGYTYVKNTSAAKKTFVWRMERKNFPSAWSSAICDKNLCYDIAVTREVFELEAGDSGNVDIHLYPNQVGGSATVNVFIFEEGDSANGKLQDMNFDAWTLSVNNPNRTTAEIYPNPATTKLNINLLTDKAISIEIYNVLGQLKKTHLHTGGTSTIDLNDLATGIYFLRYTTDEGKIISKQFKKIN